MGNQKLLIGLSSFSENVVLTCWSQFDVYKSMRRLPGEYVQNYSNLSLAHFARFLRVTEEDSVSETMVRPIFILININTTLKGTHF